MSVCDLIEGGMNSVGWIMRPDTSIEKGSTQIDIIYSEGKIQICRREYLTVQMLNPESLADPESGNIEKWLIVMLLSRKCSEDSDWTLHFSVSKVLSRNPLSKRNTDSSMGFELHPKYKRWKTRRVKTGLIRRNRQQRQKHSNKFRPLRS